MCQTYGPIARHPNSWRTTEADFILLHPAPSDFVKSHTAPIARAHCQRLSKFKTLILGMTAIATTLVMIPLVVLGMFVPIVGWIFAFAAALAIVAIWKAVLFFRTAINGPCPHCGLRAGFQAQAFSCQHCKKRVLVTATSFARVPN